MKFSITFLMAISLLASTSFAATSSETSIGDLASQVAEKINAVDSQLSTSEKDMLERELYVMQKQLSSHHNPLRSSGVACVSDGGRGAYEKFQITNTANGQTMGNTTPLATCKSLVTHEHQGLVCVSDGGRAPYEKFAVADTVTGQILGGWTREATCLQLVKNSTSQLTCLSDGGAGAFERFDLYSRGTHAVLAESTMATCVHTILQ